jgi:two-component system, cell cycle sensor histidine kinase and response regulator CckA
MDQGQPLEALGRAAGVTAHDFNNLLTIILGYTSLLLRTLPENDPSRAAINEIQMAAERGRKLTQDLLARYRAALPGAGAGERSP